MLFSLIALFLIKAPLKMKSISANSSHLSEMSADIDRTGNFTLSASSSIVQ